MTYVYHKSSKEATALQSITFIGEGLNGVEIVRNTYDDWKLVPVGMPVVVPAPLKTNYKDIPGGPGSIDLSTTVSGYPLFGDREGTWEFTLENQDYRRSYILRSKIQNFLGGKIWKCIIDNDRGWYYEGRVWISDWPHNNDGTGSNIVFSYHFSPYKLCYRELNDAWLWDPFVFETDRIENGNYTVAVRYDIQNETGRTESMTFTGSVMPLNPRITVILDEDSTVPYMEVVVSRPEDYEFTPVTYRVINGSQELPELVIFDEELYTVTVRGQGTLSINFRRGSL